ncbi:MAG: Asp-tRNA(Asn)/Glu-tRNA(Gln) amidotransferase subunit GatB, partial [Lachnospiraceae bacterium]|nr:Asp-tRNA(Asn)/Glu-tRNA(Gln) amidotransferase subunit GatB [Lachnospiraceae bacterium]
MAWETVIGLEVHVELSTATKIFCGCTTEFGGEPNTHCCPICMGMPGTLPVLNKKVLEYALKAGLALNCEITRYNKFDRKNYFYPDLPKAYQISQLYLPFARDGHIDIETESGKKAIRIHEIHMEEDAGKLIHSETGNETYPDYNRCGVPLIEIVTEPDFRSAKEVVAYLDKLKTTLKYLGVSDCKMQEGSLRADVNLSVHRPGEALGTRTEMKNINSFKAIERAIEYEAKRQIEVLESGGQIIQETRRWDDNQGKSFAMRSKENAQDYRYFPEPDIPPISIPDELLERLKAEQPELCEEKKARYMKDFGLSEYDADKLTQDKVFADLFEETTKLCGEPKEVANWMLTQLLYEMNDKAVEIENLIISPRVFAEFINIIVAGKVNNNVGKEIFTHVF